jgi:Sulfotransferase domain
VPWRDTSAAATPESTGCLGEASRDPIRVRNAQTVEDLPRTLPLVDRLRLISGVGGHVRQAFEGSGLLVRDADLAGNGEGFVEGSSGSGGVAGLVVEVADVVEERGQSCLGFGLARTWWESMDRTVPAAARSWTPAADGRASALDRLLERLAGRPEWDDARTLTAAYQRHVEEVRATVPAERLVAWQPEDGWAPLCRALRVDEPAEPFPWSNRRADWS